MIELILAFLLSLWPGHNTTTHDNNTQITIMSDTGGESGHAPNQPPPPPKNQ